jgi:hypothetical protein
VLEAIEFFYDDKDSDRFDVGGRRRIVQRADGRTLRLRVSAARVRRFARLLERGNQPVYALAISSADREGNSTYDQFVLRVRG